MIIVVAHQKGGTGKTTIAVNLAVAMGTELLDMDKQHSSIIFNHSRRQAGMSPVTCYTIAESECVLDGQQPVPEEELDEFLTVFKGHPKRHILIDCGGFDSKNNRGALCYSDYTLTPLAPSGTEMYGLQMFENILVETEERIGQHLASHVLINNADLRSLKRIEELRQYVLQKPEHFSLCRTVVAQRMAFKTSYEKGLSVEELYEQAKSAKAKKQYEQGSNEIKSLAREIYQVLGIQKGAV